MSFLPLQSACWGRESGLLYCVSAVILGLSLWCRGLLSMTTGTVTSSESNGAGSTHSFNKMYPHLEFHKKIFHIV